MNFGYIALVATLFVTLTCVSSRAHVSYSRDSAMFQALLPTSTGILMGTATNYEKMRNKEQFMVLGGGCAIGDIDGDGKPDLLMCNYFDGFFVYKNLGGWKFKDVTSQVVGKVDVSYPTGITLADVDSDGDLDIFLGRMERDSRLFINNGKGKFKEEAKGRGLLANSQVIQGTPFDADSDGDLDFYVVQYADNRPALEKAAKEDKAVKEAIQDGRQFEPVYPRFSNDPVLGLNTQVGQQLYDVMNGRFGGNAYNELRHAGTPDRFFLNNGDGTFRDYTYESWIFDKGMGLSCTAADVNGDGHTDMYISNDFSARDILYYNNGDASFANVTKRTIDHMSVFSMGTDVADFNNDGLMDIVSVDMYPKNHQRRISRSGVSGDFSSYNPDYDSNQVMRNALQLNRGDGKFSEIAFGAGVVATDWSWASLFFDADLDGWKDLFIANGYMSDISDQDYVYNMQGGALENMEKLPPLREPNYIFRNLGDLTFDDVSKKWGIDDISASIGAAYGDIDMDGDLDLVVVNLDTIPHIYRNMAVERGLGNWVQFQFNAGRHPNKYAIGTRVTVVAGGIRQVQELYPVRGFMSSVEPILAFGIGKAATIDSVIVRWHAGGEQILYGLEVNKRHTLRRDQASSRPLATAPIPVIAPVAEPVTVKGTPFDFIHEENLLDDFKRERLLPSRASWDGPGVAVGDVDSNGLDDVYIGGAFRKKARLILQIEPGSFAERTPDVILQDSLHEDVGCLFVDVDNDGDLDLYVSSGGLEVEQGEPEGQDRLYLNDGKGGFSRAPSDALPLMRESSSVVVAADYDSDGDMDLFVGGRIVTGAYPFAPRSCILRNDGGKYVDATASVAPEVERMGLVRTALWTDMDNDGDMDLLAGGDWMPIRVFSNDGGMFKETTKQHQLDTATGFWASMAPADVDNDGDMDYLVGNSGWNTRFRRPSTNEPIRIHAADFDDNGSIDPLITYVQDGQEWLMRDRTTVYSQIPTLQRQFNSFTAFARTPFRKMFSGEAMDTMLTLSVTETSNCLLVNDQGRLRLRRLPAEAQMAPIHGTMVTDVNGDGNLDVLAIGNMFGADREVVKYDAGKGLVLLGDGGGSFVVAPPADARFTVTGDGRSLACLGGTKTPSDVLVALTNQGQPVLYRMKGGGNAIAPPTLGTKAATLHLSSGKKRKVELGYGSGYLGQSPRYVRVDGATILQVEFDGVGSATGRR